jgi:hypothetical protein
MEACFLPNISIERKNVFCLGTKNNKNKNNNNNNDDDDEEIEMHV